MKGVRHKDTGDLVRYLYNDGYRIAPIAEILGISHNSVYYHLRRMRARHPTHDRDSSRCAECEYNHLQHHWCMTWE